MGLPPAFVEIGCVDVLEDEDKICASRSWASGAQPELRVGGRLLIDSRRLRRRQRCRSLRMRCGWLKLREHCEDNTIDLSRTRESSPGKLTGESDKKQISIFIDRLT